MIFVPARLAGAYLIEPTPYSDERGVFFRSFCEDEFARHGLETRFPQHSISISRRAGTLRGLHFQRAPHQEVKVVRCVSGAIVDVIADLRPDSPTYRQWQAFDLSARNGHQVYVPKGFAHGCLTLTDDAAVSYLISTPYVPDASSGVRFDDPKLGISWPGEITTMSERDQTWPLLD
ncbi:MAG: dTDP-4-dehydrorhamnose 3,5-epimerase [Hyphomicrobiaceae bacterium]